MLDACFDYPYFGSVNAEENRIHPMQKPVLLYEWLIKTYAKPGYKIISTHGGSCPEMIAAYNLSVDCVSFEINLEYYQKAVERLDNVKSQVRFAL